MRIQVTEIYDILGNEIQTLVNEYQNMGKYQVTFDGTGLSSGVYIYRIITNNFAASKQMILLK